MYPLTNHQYDNEEITHMNEPDDSFPRAHKARSTSTAFWKDRCRQTLNQAPAKELLALAKLRIQRESSKGNLECSIFMDSRNREGFRWNTRTIEAVGDYLHKMGYKCDINSSDLLISWREEA